MYSRLRKLISSFKDGSFIHVEDRNTAALVLSSIIKDKIKDIPLSDLIIVGIVRGGVIMADVIAEKLKIKNFNILIPRRLRSPTDVEFSIGALIDENNIYLNQFLINEYNIPQNYLLEEIRIQICEIQRLLKLYSSPTSCLASFYNDYYKIIYNKIVIIVDDGIASGSTLIVSYRWLKKMKPKQIIIVSSVAPRETLNFLKKNVDSIMK